MKQHEEIEVGGIVYISNILAEQDCEASQP